MNNREQKTRQDKREEERKSERRKEGKRMKENEVGSRKVQLKIFNLQDRELAWTKIIKGDEMYSSNVYMHAST